MEKYNLNDEIGEVLTVIDGQATVLFDRHAACSRCKACGIFTENQKKVSISLPAPRDVKTGDKVRMMVDARYYSISLLILYGIPCLALLVGVVVGTFLFGKDGQIWSAFLGLGATALVYLLIRTQDRRLAEWKKGKLMIEKIYSSENGEDDVQ